MKWQQVHSRGRLLHCLKFPEELFLWIRMMTVCIQEVAAMSRSQQGLLSFVIQCIDMTRHRSSADNEVGCLRYLTLSQANLLNRVCLSKPMRRLRIVCGLLWWVSHPYTLRHSFGAQPHHPFQCAICDSGQAQWPLESA